MKNKPLIIIILSGLLMILVVMVTYTAKRGIEKEALTKEGKVPDTVNKFTIKYDLYYYRHPYLARAHQLNEERKYDSAIYYYKEASSKFEKELQWESYVWVNSYIARLYLLVNGKDYREAYPYLQKALEKGIRYLGGEHPCTAITRFYFGMYFSNDQKADEALEEYHKALAILSFRDKEQNIYSSDICNEIGNVQYNLKFDNEEAEKYYLKSVNIKETLPGQIKDSVLTESYYNLVKLYFSFKDFDRAQTYCYKAIEYVPYAKHFRPYWSEMLEGVLASIYSEQHFYPKAISKLKEVIQINYTNKSDKGLLCFYYSSLGDIYSRISRYDSAITCHEKALAITNDSSLFEDQRLQAAAQNYSLGMIFLKEKKYHLALGHLNSCLSIRQKFYGAKHKETAIAFQGIGSVYQHANQPDSALFYFQKGVVACTSNLSDSGIYVVPLVSNVNTSFYSFLIMRDKASVLKQVYENNPSDIKLLYTALAYYSIADTLITQFGPRYNQEKARLIFTESNTGIYEEAIGCATLLYEKTRNSNYHNRVFNFMDKGKSGLLLEALNEDQVFKRAGINAEERKEYYLLQQGLTFLQSRLEDENSKEDPDDHILKALYAKSNILERKIHALKAAFKSKYAYYAGMQSTVDTVSLKDLQLFSVRSNSFIVEYFWGDKDIYALGVYKDQSELVKIVKDEQTETNLDLLQKSLAMGYVFATRDSDFVSFQERSFFVYNYLLKPVLARYRPGKEKNMPHLIVIPDGPISYIPFEVLTTAASSQKKADYQKLNYLIRDFTISYDYSARLLLKNYQQSDKNQRSRILALGYSGDDLSQGRFGALDMLKRDTGAELPGSAKEIRAISDYMKGEFYMGEEATEEVFKKEAPFYDILHLAVHGQADNRNSYNSRLIFKKGKDSINDGSLYSYEIYSIPLKARLVVLSACESGIGKFNPGEGMYSIARGFTYAGCPSIVMSLWQANDYSTAYIMANFYKQLSAGTSIHKAIREAKLSYINNADRRSAHPANWAAFAAMGNMAPVIQRGNSGIPVLFLTAIMVTAAFAWYVYIVRGKLKVR